LVGTAFNPSKRIGPDGRARWPSTESVAKVLAATGTGVDSFAALVSGQAPNMSRPRGGAARRIPLIGLAQAGGALFSAPVLLGGLVVAVLSSILPYSLEMMALSRLPRRVFGILVSAGPAVGALAGFFVLGEVLTTVQWMAIGLIVLATGGSAATANRS
jgi:drug/metabolite transporter (DMT)-like permease